MNRWFFIMLAIPLGMMADIDILSTPGVDARSPRVGMDSSGNCIALWIENGFVKSRTRLDGQSWEELLTVSDGNSASVDMIVDADGNATAVWLENTFVKTSSKTLEGSWEAVSILSLSGSSDPCLAVDSSGNVVAVWARNGNIESSTKLSGQAWSSMPDVIGSNSATLPKVSIGENGDVIAVWQAVNASINGIYSASKTLAGSWTGAQQISSSDFHAVRPDIAVEPNGKAIAVWFRYQEENEVFSNVIAQMSLFDGFWGAPVDISEAGIYNPKYLTIKVGFDEFQDVIVIWNNSYDGATFSLESKTKNQHLGTWYDSTSIVENLFLRDFDFKVFWGADGSCRAVFPYLWNTDIKILSSWSDIDFYKQNYWTPAKDEFETIGNNGSPKISGTLNGFNLKSVSVWENYNGSYFAVHASAQSDEYLLPPADLAIVQQEMDYGIYADLYNILTWEPSPSSDVTGYVLYRNNTMLDRLGPDVFEYIDHNRIVNQTDWYDVAAVNSKLVQSARVSIQYPP